MHAAPHDARTEHRTRHNPRFRICIALETSQAPYAHRTRHHMRALSDVQYAPPSDMHITRNYFKDTFTCSPLKSY